MARVDLKQSTTAAMMVAMLVQYTDFNQAGNVIATNHAATYAELEKVLLAMPLQLKASDQANIQDSRIFDPIGTNAHLKSKLQSLSWQSRVPMPAAFDFLGTDVDFVKQGLLVEAQFSNYPFLLNNTLRSELLFKSKNIMAGGPVECVVIITKARMFPASNSTLYYEQGVRQLTALERNQVFDVPIRLVGLFEQRSARVNVHSNTYHNARYSRTLVIQEQKQCDISNGRTSNSRCRLTIVD